MKCIHHVMAFCFFSFASTAQVSLTNPPYQESFDAIGSGLPAGFSIATGVTENSSGTAATFTSAISPWLSTTAAGFYNCASATGLINLASPTQQSQSANRALAVRQTANFGNPGAAFIFKIANTTDKTGFSLSFKLQTLDSTKQGITAWRVDYAVGANPTSFTLAPVTPANFSTGGKPGTPFYVFNRTMTANFGTNLDNKSDIVRIRVWAPLSTADPSYNTAYTLLSFNNTTPSMSSIDDWNLTWTNPVPTSVSQLQENQRSFAVNGGLNTGVQVQFNESVNSPTLMQLLSADGRIVWNKQIGQVRAGQTEFLKPEGINRGIYILTIRQKGRVYTSKLVK